MKQLVEQVKQWGVDKGLHKVGHLAQAEYTLKETAELLDAYADKEIDKINDAIGDILVTLIVGASNDDDIYNKVMENIEFFLVIQDKHKKIDGFAKLDGLNTLRHAVGTCLFLNNNCRKQLVTHVDYMDCIDALYCVLYGVNNEYNQSLSLQNCLQLAYNEIKNRTGKLVNGQFIKD